MTEKKQPLRNPVERILRMDRMPHIWCPGCGIGTVVTSFAEALRKEETDLDNIVVVSGIGCTGRVAGYIKLDSFHTTHGRAIPFATGLKLANPKTKVIVFSGDGDIAGIGGNHLIHAARRNMDLVVIVVNNFNYAMTGGQVAATTPLDANASTAPFGNFEYPFNLPHLVNAAGGTYIARWTALHLRRVTKSIQEAMHRRGFSFIEVITPCTTLYARRNRLGDGLNLLKYYYDNSEIQHNADTKDLDIKYQGKLIVGKFVDKEKPTFLDAMNQHLSKVLGDKYKAYGEENND
jgi:2-oxoglutarate ferredoxin oxidoreductase subunit beta